MLRIVPWSSRDEWLETYRNLYNFDNPNQQRDGLDRVEAWKSRSGSKLPLAVEATASLINAGMEDVESITRSHVVQQTMAMVIVRFVNGMVDMEQKGAYARSVQSIADEIGLPDWLVDLRHEATHASLPSLEVLRAGCRFALDWLRERYWESQIAEFRERDENLVALLKEYAQLCENSKGVKKKTKNSKNKKITQEIADLVSKYNMWETLLDQAFGEQGLLLPPLEMLQKMFPDSTIQSTEISSELPTDVHQWFAPLLKALHTTNDMFLTDLVSFLTRRLHELEQSSTCTLLVQFYSCFIYNILSNCSQKNGEKQWKFKAKLDYFTLLEVCLKNPLKCSQQFLQLVVENIEIPSESLKDKLHKFLAIKPTLSNRKSLDKPAQNEKTNFDILYKQFPLVARRIQAKLSETERDISGWQKCPNSFAHSHRFGAFIGEELLQNQNFDQVNEESMQLAVNFEDETSAEQNEEELEENCSENESESDLNEMEIISSSNQASDASTEDELTPEIIQEISENIWIF